MGKSIFISYRRAESNYEAQYVFKYLIGKKSDVFMDVENLDSGEYLPIILHEIKVRKNFLVILTPGALLRSAEPGDWLTKEFEHARKHKSNIVPVMMSGFTFAEEKKRFKRGKIPKMVNVLEGYNGINVPLNYEEAALEKLVNRFLKAEKKDPVTRADEEVKPVLQAMLTNAKNAEAKSNEWVFPTGRIDWRSYLYPSQGLKNISVDAPKLKKEGTGLSWNIVFGAVGYVLQYSFDKVFKKPTVKYEGKKNYYSYSGLSLPGYYRVKAKGGIYRDSGWSNVIEPNRLDKDFFGRSTLNWGSKLDTPKLTLFLFSPVVRLSWEKVDNATSYTVEASFSEQFNDPEKIYEGPNTSCFYRSGSFTTGNDALFTRVVGPIIPRRHFYRVKAKGALLAYSDWSNIVSDP